MLDPCRRFIGYQVLDRWAATNFGAKAAGMLVAKQAPLSDPQQQFLQDVYKALCSGQKPDPETVAQIDRRALGKRVEMPLLDKKTVQTALATQQTTSPSTSMPSSGLEDGETASQSQGRAADDLAALTLADELTSDHWITKDHRHIYLKDADPHRLLAKTGTQPKTHTTTNATSAPATTHPSTVPSTTRPDPVELNGTAQNVIERLNDLRNAAIKEGKQQFAQDLSGVIDEFTTRLKQPDVPANVPYSADTLVGLSALDLWMHQDLLSIAQ